MLINGIVFLEINHAITNTFTVSYKIEMCHYSSELFPVSRSLWTHRLRLLSAAACFLVLRVRIPPGTRTSLSFKCCVFSGRDFCDGPIPCPEES
jgi:hypothetical protein